MNDCETLIANVIFEQDLEETLLKNIPRLRKLDEDGTPYITYNRLMTVTTASPGIMMYRKRCLL